MNLSSRSVFFGDIILTRVNKLGYGKTTNIIQNYCLWQNQNEEERIFHQ